ncbi:hypothetical protein AHiyo4_24580 [Arthrobacter sp. Hiyo4]|nr:hypothetical protein AHiyo4_24580 [Arthrobacter sp. Hiyo4]
MTTNDSRSPEALHDKGIVESLLAEAGINDPSDAGLLTPALMSIRGLARGPHPVPSGELAALLAGLNAGTTVGPGSGAVSSLEAHRTKRRTRLVIAAAALSFSLGAGAAAAVASPDFRDAMHSTVSTLVQTLASSGSADRPGTPCRTPPRLRCLRPRDTRNSLREAGSDRASYTAGFAPDLRWAANGRKRATP